MNKDEIREIQLAIHDLINKEEYDKALPLIYSVLEEYPNEAATLNFLGYIWLMGDKPAFAYPFFRRALQETGDHIDSYIDACAYLALACELITERDENYV